jgi:hypothetical protein
MTDARDEQSDAWYWDLEREVAVRAADRGPGDHTLGPYPTKGDAENWKAKSEVRNEAWDDDDERWNEWRDERPAEHDH